MTMLRLFFLLLICCSTVMAQSFDGFPVIGPYGDVVLHDMDGDGDLDLLRCTGEDIDVHWNDGSGKFNEVDSLPVQEPELCRLSPIELDGDGDIDLVKASKGRVELVFWKDGSFSEPVPLREEAGTFFDAAVGDLTGDGLADIVTVGDKVVFLHENLGQGKFEKGQRLLIDRRPRCAVIGDLDGDGKNELLVSSFPGGLFLYTLDDQKVFTSQKLADGESLTMTLADLNGDGWSDLVTLDSSRVTVRYNRDGKLAEPIQKLLNFGGGLELEVCDLDGDGDLDILLPNEEHCWFTLLVNEENKSFREENPPGTGSFCIETGDLDGDTRPDLVVSGIGTTVIHQTADGFARLLKYPVEEPHTLLDQTVVDIDRDGALDLVVNDDTSRGITMLLNRDTDFVETPGPLGVLISSTDAGDFDRDGHDDLIISTMHKELAAVARNIENDDFGELKKVAVKGDARWSDLDSDGDLDLVSVHRSGIDYCFFDQGEAGEIRSLEFPGARLMIVGELSGDQFPDFGVVARTPGGSIARVYRNDGEGGFTLAKEFETEQTTSYEILIEDFDGDGQGEVAISSRFETKLFTPDGRLLRTLPFGGDLEAVDLDADGDLDLVFAMGLVGCYTNDGSGQFSRGSLWQVGDIAYLVTSADFNNDDLPDLAVCGAKGLYLLLNQFP